MNVKYTPNRLFAEPSFLQGFSSIIDLGGTLQEYNTSRTENEADINALLNDWLAVGNDIKGAVKKYEQESS